MSKKYFKIVAVVIGVVLIASMGAQMLWLNKMYSGLDEQYRAKIRSAMERAAYKEILQRSAEADSSAEASSEMVVSNITMTSMCAIPPQNISAISVYKQNPANPSINLFLKSSVDIGFFNEHLYDSLFRQELHNYGIEADYSIKTTMVKKVPDAGVKVENFKIKNGGDTSSVTVIQYKKNNEKLKKENVISTVTMMRSKIADGKSAKVDVSGNVAVKSGTFKDSVVVTYQSDSTKAFSSPMEFSFPISNDNKSMCYVTVENPNKEFLADMSGVIISSVVIFLLLCVSFVYLLLTIFKQKSISVMRRDFTHNITHELKTPIAVAYAANDAMVNFDIDKDPQKRAEYLQIVGSQLNLLSSMVERILSLSVEESDKFEISRKDVFLLPMVEDICDSLAVKYRSYVQFDISVLPEDFSIYADEFHFRNALMNIIDNALKYSGDNPQVCISADSDRIAVEDNGPGIPYAERRHIFEKYYRISEGDRHNVKGFGIGLYYTLIVLKKHSWGIVVSNSIKLGGAKFEIIL